MTEYRNIPIFLPELACPHQCVFCNQQHISGSLTIPQPKEIYLIIEQNLATMLPDAHIQVAFFGGSFTGLPLDIQHAYLQAVQPYIIQGRVAGIRLSTRPDYITHEIVNMLANYGVQEIELGVQSVHNDVLLKSGRGHTYEDIQRASAIILQSNIRLGLQMMIGLPGD
ncbi:MAG TPA: radical SAM protein, partial [Bacteroidales bacterium]|nr:radical SAM protein [Bacteroidales bacterium]